MLDPDVLKHTRTHIAIKLLKFETYQKKKD